MALRAHRYYNRSKRYDMEQNDLRHMRLVREPLTAPAHYETEILNVSETGIAFLMKIKEVPNVGEMLMLEFTPPGGNRIAWYGKVVRIELPQDRAAWKSFSTMALVAVQFHKMPSAFRHEIREGLDIKFRQIEFRKRKEKFIAYAMWMQKHWKKILLYAFSLLFTAMTLYMLSRPTPNYNERDPSIWGERKW